jgi:hypothetical protein
MWDKLFAINENWGKYNVQDELVELGHDSNNQQQCDEMKELEVAGTPELSPALVPWTKLR